MNRRTFIIVGSAAFGAAAVSYYVTLDDGTSSPSTLALIWEPETIAEVGKKYRASFPVEDNHEKLTDLLATLKGKDVELVVKEDFVAGRTVQIDGWIISLTEARQCALASLPS